ncbi:MAG: NADH-quinone oxidoreductase subunit NuoK [Actinomycetia bacterium]|nr:NADH-quinone oxidoreductase subunit NuoK [Actinomycetes bacterium]
MSILVVCAALFSLGVYGILVRRDIVGVLASIEVMLGAATVQLIGLSMSSGVADPALTEAIGLVLLVLVAAEAAIGLGLLVTVARHSDRSRVDELTEVEG